MCVFVFACMADFFVQKLPVSKESLGLVKFKSPSEGKHLKGPVETSSGILLRFFSSGFSHDLCKN